MNSRSLPLEQLLYDSFANVFHIRLQVQEFSHPAVLELKALEDRLWRLFIRHAYRDPQLCLSESAA